MKINGRDYELKYTGRTLVIYKEQFKSDLLLDSQKIQNDFDMVTIMQICWSMVKSANKEAPDFEEFLDQVEVNISLVEEMTACLFSDGSPSKEIKKK